MNVKNIYSFEPIPHTFRYLEKHIKLNGIKKVTAFNFGFSDSIEERLFIGQIERLEVRP